MEMNKCPICNKNTLLINQVVQEIPFFGKILLLSLVCKNCGFKHNDVFSLEIKEPCSYSLHVEKEDDVNVKIVRSSSGTVEIPELGVRIEPGPASQGFITTIEGVLERIENVIKGQLPLLKGRRRKKAEKMLKDLKKMKEGRKKFTIKIKDPFGNSFIISEKVKKRRLSERELKKLKVGMITLDLVKIKASEGR